MRNEKKIAFQQKRIAELTKQVEDLKQKNLALSSQLEINKSSILLREKALDDKEANLNIVYKTYEAALFEVIALENKYKQGISEISKLKKRYIVDMDKQLQRITNQK